VPLYVTTSLARRDTGGNVMSATLIRTAGSGPAIIASSDPGAASLFGAVPNGWPVSSASYAATLRCLIVDDSPYFLDDTRYGIK
jgi:hypothetical protein